MTSRALPLLVAFALGALAAASTHAQAADTTPPWPVGWGPTGTGVPVNTGILVAWSETMDRVSIEASFNYTDGVAVFTQGTWTHDDARNTSSFVPAEPLHAGILYTVRFDTNARDVAGNRLDRNRNGVGGDPCDIGPPTFWDCLVWSFETAPPVPRVLSAVPTEGGTATTNASFRIIFSEPMDTASVDSAFHYYDGYSAYDVGDGSASWTATSGADDTFWFRPRLEFPTSGRITGYLFDGARDLAGNRLDGDGDGELGGAFAWTFFVVNDPRPPRAIATSPLLAATNVSVSTSIRIQFTKSMTVLAPAITLRTANGPNLTLDDGVPEVTGSRFPADTYMFDLYPNLRTGSEYTVVASADLATDREGLRLDGNGNGTAEGSPTDDYQFTFRTEAEDRTAPTVVRGTPSPESVGAYPGTPFHVDFSEPMDRAAVEASFSFTDGARVFNVSDGTAVWWFANTSFVFRPSTSLSYGVQVTVTFAGGVARDTAGNPLNAGANETWSFTTASQPDAAPPHVVSTSPFDGQRNVSRNARITIVFSEAMDHASVEESVGITGGASLRDYRWPNDATLDLGTAAPMAYRSPYAILVFTGAKDLAGNPIPQPVQIGFTTETWRGKVSGRVADEAGAGIRGALVRLNGYSYITDDAGGFVFEVEQGTYTVIVSVAGYETVTKPFTIAPGGGSLGTITLRRLPVSAIDAALWTTLGAGLLVVVLIAMWLRRHRRRTRDHYETWTPAKVVVLEPGKPPPKGP